MTDAPEGFTRTLQTAAEAIKTADLIERAWARAKKAGLYEDARALLDLSRKYRDYAAALREAAVGPPVVEDEQGALL